VNEVTMTFAWIYGRAASAMPDTVDTGILRSSRITSGASDSVRATSSPSAAGRRPDTSVRREEAAQALAYDLVVGDQHPDPSSISDRRPATLRCGDGSRGGYPDTLVADARNGHRSGTSSVTVVPPRGGRPDRPPAVRAHSIDARPSRCAPRVAADVEADAVV
jgi:hypothetical protein